MPLPVVDGTVVCQGAQSVFKYRYVVRQLSGLACRPCPPPYSSTVQGASRSPPGRLVCQRCEGGKAGCATTTGIPIRFSEVLILGPLALPYRRGNDDIYRESSIALLCACCARRPTTRCCTSWAILWMDGRFGRVRRERGGELVAV